jgi:hypothetical protein
VVYGQNIPNFIERIMAAFEARTKTPAGKLIVGLSRPFDDPLPPDVRDLDLITFVAGSPPADSFERGILGAGARDPSPPFSVPVATSRSWPAFVSGRAWAGERPRRAHARAARQEGAGLGHRCSYTLQLFARGFQGLFIAPKKSVLCSLIIKGLLQ